MAALRKAVARPLDVAVAFLHLDSRSRRCVLRAALAAGVVELGLRTLPLPSLAHLLGITISDRGPTVRPAIPTEDWTSMLRCVDALFRRYPRQGRCLRRALVLGNLLRHHGPVLRLGVAAHPRGVSAHAWIEIGGVRLPDEDGRSFEGYVPLR